MSKLPNDIRAYEEELQDDLGEIMAEDMEEVLIDEDNFEEDERSIQPISHHRRPEDSI